MCDFICKYLEFHGTVPLSVIHGFNVLGTLETKKNGCLEIIVRSALIILSRPITITTNMGVGEAWSEGLSQQYSHVI